MKLSQIWTFVSGGLSEFDKTRRRREGSKVFILKRGRYLWTLTAPRGYP